MLLDLLPGGLATRAVVYASILLFVFGAGWHYGQKGPTKALIQLQAKAEATEKAYAGIVTSTQRDSLIHEERRTAVAAVFRTRAHDLPKAVTAVPVPVSVVSLLHDASSDEVTRPTPEPETASTPDPGVSEQQRIDWELAVLDWGRECRDRVQDWTNFYNSLQRQQ